MFHVKFGNSYKYVVREPSNPMVNTGAWQNGEGENSLSMLNFTKHMDIYSS